jgi:hypothetical protein
MLSRFHGTLSTLVVALSVACTDDAQDGKASEVTHGSVDASHDVDASGKFDQDSAQIALSCPSALLTETDTSGFLVKVTDAQGRVPDGKGLWVRLNPSTGTVSAAKAGGAETDENGEVSFAYVAPHFDFTTTIMLEASVIGAQERVLAKEQCSFKVVTEAFRFVAPAKDSYVRAGRATPIEIEVLVDGVPPACEDDGGVKLTLTGPTGAGLALSEDATFTRELCVDLIDQGRAASALVRAGTSGSTGRLRASLGAASAELALKFVGQVAALQLSADATEIEVGSGANLGLTAIDDIGQPVPGVALELALTRCAATGCSGGEAISPATVTTDMNGKATAAYFAGNAAGAAQLTATVKSARSVKESLIVRVSAATP